MDARGTGSETLNYTGELGHFVRVVAVSDPREDKREHRAGHRQRSLDYLEGPTILREAGNEDPHDHTTNALLEQAIHSVDECSAARVGPNDVRNQRSSRIEHDGETDALERRQRVDGGVAEGVVRKEC